jgi:hypothetical protein
MKGTLFDRQTAKCLGKTLLWVGANGVYGLAPFLFVGLLSLLGINNRSTQVALEEFNHLLNDGVLVLYSCAVMGAIAVDIFFARRKFKEQMAFVILFIGSSLLVLIVTIAVYLVLLYTAKKGHLFVDLPRFQVAVIGIAIIFCILAKTILFLKENQEE